ncbi:MAG: ParA family protein [Propionibacteriaceae bacterium]|nr:ParA family protein [Propionibacteriaceae bacterium]
MTKIVAIASGGGSTGKTTTAVTLATLAAAQGSSVVVVDADAQGTATRWLGVDPRECLSDVGDVLLHGVPIIDAIIPSTVPGVSLLPAAEDLEGVVVQLSATYGGERKLRAALKPLTHDLVIVDSPGSLNLVTCGAIVAANHVITTTFPTNKELRSIQKLYSAVNELAQAHDLTISVDAIIPCMVPPVNAGGHYQDAMSLLHNQPWDNITPSVRRSVKVAESFAAQIPLPLYCPREHVSVDYGHVHDHLVHARIL